VKRQRKTLKKPWEKKKARETVQLCFFSGKLHPTSFVRCFGAECAALLLATAKVSGIVIDPLCKQPKKNGGRKRGKPRL